jgi:hypothetical protein
MSQEENLLNQEPIKEEPKKSSGKSWVSLLLSGFFIIRGFMYISEGITVWGSIMLLVGIGGIIWKLYEMNKSKEA